VASHRTRRGGSAIDGRTTRHPGYAISQTIRKRIEEHFGWGKTIGRIRPIVYRGIKRVDQHFQIDDDRKQHCANGPNVQRGAARSGTMSRPCEPRDTAPMPDGDNQPSTRRTTHRLLSHQLQ